MFFSVSLACNLPHPVSFQDTLSPSSHFSLHFQFIPTLHTYSFYCIIFIYRWRAAEHLCQYFIDNPQHLQDKSACELGAGLGMVSILVDKMNVCTNLVVTDGDEDTISLLIENQVENDCTFSPSYLYWGEHEDFVSDHEEGFDVVFAADVIYEEEQIAPLISTVSAILKSKLY